MKLEWQQHSDVDALGQILRALMADNDVGWDECLYRQESSEPGHFSFTYTYRSGRELAYIPKKDKDKEELLFQRTSRLLQRIGVETGTMPKVGVLSIQADGRSRFFHDIDAESMDITFHTIGLRNGYFTRAQIDPPDFMLEKLAEGARWEKLLEGGATFELSFVASDFGYPCPDSLRAVEDAITRELTDPGIGKVLRVTFQDVGDVSYERLHIGVVDLEQGGAHLGALMRKLRAPASTTLRLIEPREAACTMGLKPKGELVVEHTNYLMQELVHECIRCAPASWEKGVLTVRTNGNWIDYMLKNDASPERANISPALRQLCEDFSVIRWLKGDKWSRATLRYTRSAGAVDYDVVFSYDPADGPENQAPAPDPDPPASPRPWWKVW